MGLKGAEKSQWAGRAESRRGRSDNYLVFCRSEAQPLAVPTMELREVKMLFCLGVNYTPKGLEAMGKNPESPSEKFRFMTRCLQRAA